MREWIKLRRGKGSGSLKKLKKYLTSLKLVIQFVSRDRDLPKASPSEPSPSIGKPAPKPVRVLGLRLRNLPADLTPTAAMEVMEAALWLNKGAAADFVHMSLSPHPNDGILDDATWRLIWEVYARELGLDRVPAIVVTHGDGHKRWRKRTGDARPIYHEHAAISLVDPRSRKRLPVTDMLQRIEIAKAYVERRWGVTISKPRERLRWKPYQRERRDILARLGREHREAEVRREKVALPERPALARQRKRDDRMRYLRRKETVAAVRSVLATIDRMPETWTALQDKLAEHGLKYQVGRFRVGKPDEVTARFVFAEPHAAQIPASAVGAQWRLDRVVEVLGPSPIPAPAASRGGRRQKLLDRLPDVLGHAPQDVLDTLAAHGLAYEVRVHRGAERAATVGWLRDTGSGQVERASGPLALSALKKRFDPAAFRMFVDVTLSDPSVRAPEQISATPNAVSSAGPDAETGPMEPTINPPDVDQNQSLNGDETESTRTISPPAPSGLPVSLMEAEQSRSAAVSTAVDAIGNYALEADAVAETPHAVPVSSTSFQP